MPTRRAQQQRVIPMALPARNAAPPLDSPADQPRPRARIADIRRIRRLKQWPILRYFRWRRPSEDGRVQTWKGAWIRGANAGWGGRSSAGNPYDAGSLRANAWLAGWRWSQVQPDRRTAKAVRLAHSYRRHTDPPVKLIHGASSPAIGLSILAIAGWIWRVRARR